MHKPAAVVRSLASLAAWQLYYGSVCVRARFMRCLAACQAKRLLCPPLPLSLSLSFSYTTLHASYCLPCVPCMQNRRSNKQNKTKKQKQSNDCSAGSTSCRRGQ